jgi:hypothetical protein
MSSNFYAPTEAAIHEEIKRNKNKDILYIKCLHISLLNFLKQILNFI